MNNKENEQVIDFATEVQNQLDVLKNNLFFLTEVVSSVNQVIKDDKIENSLKFYEYDRIAFPLEDGLNGLDQSIEAIFRMASDVIREQYAKRAKEGDVE